MLLYHYFFTFSRGKKKIYKYTNKSAIPCEMTPQNTSRIVVTLTEHPFQRGYLAIQYIYQFYELRVAHL